MTNKENNQSFFNNSQDILDNSAKNLHNNFQNKLTGAEIIVQALINEGVDTIFGYPGGAILPLYDALFSQDKIQHILTRHEQGASHSAEGYARSTGRVGVITVTSGPGATNTITGLADAFLDSIPLVCISGQVSTAVLGTDGFQEADITGLPVLAPNIII